MADIAAIMRRLADEIEREDAGEQTAAQATATEERIAALEEQLKAAKRKEGPAAAEDALEEISDEEMELIRAHRAGTISPPTIELPAVDPLESVKTKTRPGRKKGEAYQWTVADNGKVQKTDIAHVYSGEDEPDLVELAGDESAAA